MLSVRIALVSCLLALCCCTAPKAQRLREDPASAKQWTSTGERTPPVADAINRFNRAVLGGQLQLAYAQLSRATRRALEERARPAGLRGVDLLAKGQRGHVAPLKTFTATKIAKLQVPDAPYPDTKAHDGRLLVWKVGVVTAAGVKRTLTLRFEGLAWRIHNPQLSAK